jgi:hypothetical protein
MSEPLKSHVDAMREIRERWRYIPRRLRIAAGLDDAMNDWPIADFGPGDDDKAAWLCTDHVHASEMVASCLDVARAMVKAPDDIRTLFRIIRELGGPA